MKRAPTASVTASSARAVPARAAPTTLGGAPDAGPRPSAEAAASAERPTDSGEAVASAEPAASTEPAPSGEAAASAQPPPSASVSATLPEGSPGGAVAPVASATAAVAGSPVLLGDDEVFSIRVARGGKTALQRAQDATRALTAAAREAKGGDVHVERKGELAILFVGVAPIVQLDADDAQAAGDASLDLHAASAAAAVREAIDSERRREALAKTVFSISLLVFLALIVFYLVRKIGEFAERARVFLDAHGERVLAVRVREIEVVSPATVKSTALVGLSVAKWLAQLGTIYAWLVVVMSLFDATRGYTERLTGFVLTPLSQLMTRLATGLPVLVVLIVAGFAVFVLVRFIGLFLGSVERRETTVTWLSADLAAPTSALVRVGVVLAALVFLAPLVTGSQEGALSRVGAIILVSLGLAATPAFATAVLGSIVLFGRRLRPGQHVEVGPYAGRIARIGLLDLRLETADGAEIRVPHLYALYQPMRVVGLRGVVTTELAVAPGARLSDVRDLLLRVAREQGHDAAVELLRVDRDGAAFRVRLHSEARDARSALTLALCVALERGNIALGRLGEGGS